MPADIASKPYDQNKKYEHIYLCRKYPMIRLVYKRRSAPGEAEQYIGFLKHAAGGIFQTNDKQVAAFMDALLADGEHGQEFEKISHEELGELLATAPTEKSRVNRGPTASRQTDRSEDPEPDESEPRKTVSARGPKGRKSEPVEA